ncbi:Fe2OG dioxygenase domain-containing protein [Balamuthia mandrillaris]
MEIEALSQWDRGSNSKVVMLLDHLYTEEGLLGRGLAALKGKDLVLADIIRAANAMVDPEHRVSLWLVYLEQKKEFFKRYHRWEENQEPDEHSDSFLRANLDFRWYTAAGQPLRLYRPINFDKDVVILDTHAVREQGQEEEEEEHAYCCNEEIEDETCRAVFCFPGQSEVKGYTGNEGPTKTTTYHRSALVIWPEAQELQLGLKAGGLYGMAACVHAMTAHLRSKEREHDKKQLLSQVDTVLDTWTDMSSKLKKVTTTGSIARTATFLLKTIPRGEVGPVQRITDLLSKVEPHNVAAAYKHDLEELAEELTKCLSRVADRN